MSLSSAIGRRFVSEVETLTVLLSEFISRWKSASTEGEKLAVESEAIVMFQKLIDLDIELQTIQTGDHPELTEMGGFYTDHVRMMRASLGQLRKIAESYLDYFNTSQIHIMSLIGRLKRIRQKQAVLDLWSTDEARFVISERFLNFDNLGDVFISQTRCDIDVNQGILTLPVRAKNEINIKSIRIAASSNGSPGNSDIRITTNNINPEFMINSNPGNWFEYERLDDGPVELTMILELDKESVINSLELEPVNIGVGIPFEIRSILFSSSTNETLGMNDLAGTKLPKDFYSVGTIGNDTAWAATFLPVSAKTITMTLSSSRSVPVEVVTTDSSTALRDRFAIAIRNITLFRKEFESVGEINSLAQRLPGKYFASIPYMDVWPNNQELYSFIFEVSFDNGETWERSDGIEDGIGSTVLMRGQENSVIWRLNVERKDDLFKFNDSFSLDERLTPNIAALLRSVSRFQSPVEISLSSKPVGSSVIAMQPQIARRGAKENRILLGEGRGTEATFDLPFDVIRNRLVGGLSVYVNGIEYSLQLDSNVAGNGEYSFVNGFKDLYFAEVPNGAKVEVLLEKEEMIFEEKTDGFYHYNTLLFDPDKNNIQIVYLPRAQSSKTIALSRDEKFIDLEAKNIVDTTFSLVSGLGNTYTEVDNVADVLATPDSYYIDYAEGILQLNATLDDDYVQVTFEYQEEQRVAQENFDVVFDGALPVGIRINKDSFSAIDYTETIGDPTLKIIDIGTGYYAKRLDRFAGSTNAKTLSYGGLIRNSVRVSDDLLQTSSAPIEVKYINGKREFLGLVEMLNEYTIAIDSGAQDFVEFSLSAGALWWNTITPTFSNTTVFANKQNNRNDVLNGAVGDYYINRAGLVTVNVGNNGTLTPDIRIKYTYIDPNFNAENKYSINYRDGVIYSYKAMNEAATISYKAAQYLMGYDIALLLSDYEYNSEDNSISVRTENLKSINNLVKIVWVESETNNELAEIKDFFSPLVRSIGIRFN